jgi:hypothetical protein
MHQRPGEGGAPHPGHRTSRATRSPSATGSTDGIGGAAGGAEAFGSSASLIA